MTIPLLKTFSELPVQDQDGLLYWLDAHYIAKSHGNHELAKSIMKNIHDKALSLGSNGAEVFAQKNPGAHVVAEAGTGGAGAGVSTGAMGGGTGTITHGNFATYTGPQNDLLRKVKYMRNKKLQSTGGWEQVK